jgi:hypothetical protein
MCVRCSLRNTLRTVHVVARPFHSFSCPPLIITLNIIFMHFVLYALN